MLYHDEEQFLAKLVNDPLCKCRCPGVLNVFKEKLSICLKSEGSFKMIFDCPTGRHGLLVCNFTRSEGYEIEIVDWAKFEYNFLSPALLRTPTRDFIRAWELNPV